MSENDQKAELEEAEEAEIEEGTEGEESGEEEAAKTKSKPKLTPEQKRGILQRQLTKLNKELGIVEKEAEPKVEKKEVKKGFDYAEKAYLKASGISGDEFALVEEYVENTGKSIDDILELKVFQAELKEKREASEVKEALPSGARRSSSSTKTNVDYWISKGELPPEDQVELRRKVVNERIAREKRSYSS